MSAEENPAPRSQGFWAGLWLASVALVAALKLSGAIGSTHGFILFAGSMVLLIPMMRAGRRRGCASPATDRYNRRVVAASFGYVLGLGIAIGLWRNYTLSDGLVFAISLLPTLPTIAMVWAMGRYVTEEKDEYLLHRTIMSALAGLGFVLAAGIFYGFLEMFELVPHVWAWWVLPVWAIGMGLSQLWQRVRGA